MFDHAAIDDRGAAMMVSNSAQFKGRENQHRTLNEIGQRLKFCRVTTVMVVAQTDPQITPPWVR